jgi:hypothetical protein
VLPTRRLHIVRLLLPAHAALPPNRLR